MRPLGDERPLFQTQIPLNPGASGGPVVDKQGRAIGVVTMGIIEAQSINFAVPVEQAVARLSQLSDRCDCLVRGGSPPSLRARTYVRLQ